MDDGLPEHITDAPPGFAEARETMDAAERFIGPSGSGVVPTGAEPPPPPPEGGGDGSISEALGGISLPPLPPPQEEEELEAGRLPRNDLGNALRLIRRRGRDLIYIPGRDWYAWVGSHWSQDHGEQLARRAAQEVPGLIAGEAGVMEAAGAGPREKEEEFARRIATHHKWSVATGNSNRMAALLREAEPRLQHDIAEMDAKPLLLTVLNGVLDLAAKGPKANGGVALLPHQRGHLSSRIMPVRYDPNATAPLWTRFMAQVMPDPEKRLFLQRYSGYCLTGETGEQCLLLLYGRGANGKSTYMDVFARLLGPFAMTMDFASLKHDDKKRGGDATPDLIDLPGKRLVMAAEPEPGTRLSEGLIKSLTGGDEIRARALNKPFISFYPQFKMILSFNTKPGVTGTDNGIWRRLKLLDWPVTIPENERDRHLKSKLLAEAPGILNWLLDGYRLWREQGLAPPASVAAATAAWREDADRMGAFIETACIMDPKASVSAQTLFRAYEKWCRQNAVDAVNPTVFGRGFPERCTEFGVRKEKMGGFITYIGVTIRSDYLPDSRPDDD